MSNVDIIMSYWQIVDKQEWDKLKDCFSASATVEWPNTNECFIDINNFIRANCEYPGNWSIMVEKIEEIGNKIITVSKVLLTEKNFSFYAVSFFEITEGRIEKLTEYWGDNGNAPEWRRKLNLSTILA